MICQNALSYESFQVYFTHVCWPTKNNYSQTWANEYWPPAYNDHQFGVQIWVLITYTGLPVEDYPNFCGSPWQNFNRLISQHS